MGLTMSLCSRPSCINSDLKLIKFDDEIPANVTISTVLMAFTTVKNPCSSDFTIVEPGKFRRRLSSSSCCSAAADLLLLLLTAAFLLPSQQRRRIFRASADGDKWLERSLESEFCCQQRWPRAQNYVTN